MSGAIGWTRHPTRQQPSCPLPDSDALLDRPPPLASTSNQIKTYKGTEHAGPASTGGAIRAEELRRHRATRADLDSAHFWLEP